MDRPALAVIAVACAALPAQQQQWQITSNATDELYGIWPFADWNGDGTRDFFCTYNFNLSSIATQLRSGADGAVLWQQVPSAYRAPTYAGDVDGDGKPDVAAYRGGAFVNVVAIYSISRDVELWQNSGPSGILYGDSRIANIDVDGDRRMDFVTCTSHSTACDVYVYNSTGATLYTLPMLAQGRIVNSMANMGDLDGDQCDDFVLGCAESTQRGVLRLVSGRTGATLRESFGISPGDKISACASNLGDIDGDGVNDYAGFPYWSATNLRVTAFSGATGAVLHTWQEYANSVVTGEDFDLDGVPDVVMGADWVITSSCNGSTRCYSGRDGSLLWQLDNAPLPPGTGSSGQQGWMEVSTNLGVQPGSPYPVVAWWDHNFWLTGNLSGRTRAFNTARAGQGPVTGTPCTTTGHIPLIGVRQTTTGARVTIAKTLPGAAAWLNLSLATQTSYGGLPLPIDLTSFGFAGCSLQVAPSATYFRTLGTTGNDRGYAAVDLPFQLTASLTGLRLAAQWVVFDPATLGHAFTQKHELRAQ